MPRFNPADADLEQHKIGGTHFGFSAAKLADLGSSEYTLVTLVLDVSGSVHSFAKGLEDAVKEAVKSCSRSPRADNLLIRVVRFDDRVEEFHGFRPLADVKIDDYNGVVSSGGMTALFDATYASVKAMTQYGADLTKNDYQVNGIVFILTDGDDNASKTTAKMVAQALAEARSQEAMESILPVLIGVNTDAATGLSTYLEQFKNDAGFTQYVEMAKADEKTLAKLGMFISKSVSSQSQALGSGGPSKSLSF